MMNEAIYRAPDWMKKFSDFEIHTGKDKLSQQEKDRRKSWKMRWNAIQWQRGVDSKVVNDFKEFLESILGPFLWTEYNAKLSIIYDKYKLNDDIWVKFGKFLHDRERRNAEKRERDRQRAKEHTDSRRTKSNDDSGFGKFWSYVDDFIGGDTNKDKKSSDEPKQKYEPKSNVRRETPTDNQRRKYKLLKTTLDGYIRQLERDKSAKVSTDTLENEITVIRQKIADMKSQYQFEHLMRFDDYQKI